MIDILENLLKEIQKNVDFLLRLRFSRYRQTPLQSYTSKSPRRSVSVSLLLLIASKYGELGEARIGANAFFI